MKCSARRGASGSGRPFSRSRSRRRRLTWNASLTPLVEGDYDIGTLDYLDTHNVQVSTLPVWYPALTLLNSASDDANIVNKIKKNF